jgi:6-phosphofructokinase
MKTIGIVTGGGDAPGLNAVIRAAVKTAVGEFGMRVVGIEDSFEGLLGQTHVRELTAADVRGLLPRGGTILGTRNRGRFVVRGDDGAAAKPEEIYREAIGNLSRLGIDALVAVGGEGTLAIAHEFHRRDFPVVGVPKTIDNDLAATELTFGFMTALDIATEALDRLHTTAESHDRVMVLEVMGRHTGWIALHSGVSGGADVILIPEIPFSTEKVADKIRERDASGSQFTIIVASEGAKEIEGHVMYVDKGDRQSAARQHHGREGCLDRIGIVLLEIGGKRGHRPLLQHREHVHHVTEPLLDGVGDEGGADRRPAELAEVGAHADLTALEHLAEHLREEALQRSARARAPRLRIHSRTGQTEQRLAIDLSVGRQR